MKIRAFTLAEILITLGIIGVVASLTIPQLKQKTNEKELVSGYLKSHNVLTNAYKEAEAVKGYKLYGLNPDEFKEYFEEHLKMLGKSNCKHDVCLLDGSVYDYECDENKCNYLIIDTNGDKRPNQIGKDIYKLKITLKGLISEGEREICSGYDCGNYVLANHKIFDGLLEGCESYGEDGRCSLCSDGYKNVGGLCSALNTPNCTAYSGESCTTCADGYSKYNSSCVNNNGGCIDNDCSQKNFNGIVATKVGDKYVADRGKTGITIAEAEQYCSNKGLVLANEQTLDSLCKQGKISEGIYSIIGTTREYEAWTCSAKDDDGNGYTGITDKNGVYHEENNSTLCVDKQ